MPTTEVDSGATPGGFLHHLGVLISRSLNTLNPNEALAKRVFQLSTSLDLAGFTKAIATFGKFSANDAQEIFELCQTQDTMNEAFKVPGLTITDADVTQPDAPGGRPGLTAGAGEKHVFKAPALPRHSELGLDRLALEKRRERAELERPSVKRLKYDDDDEESGEFKSGSLPCQLGSGA